MLKKLLFSTMMLVLAVGYANAQNVDVTFVVQAPPSSPVYVQGSWNWSIYPGAPLTNIGGDTWAGTVTIPQGAQFEYVYWAGASGAEVKEALDYQWTCTNGNQQYTNRIILNGASQDTVISDIFASCNPGVPPVQHTFVVENPPATPVYLFGSWDWTAWPGEMMTVDPADPTHFMATRWVPGNSSVVEYLFVYDSAGTPVKETLDPAWLCTNGNGQYTNRVLRSGAVSDTSCEQWSSCLKCGQVPVDVTFQVQFPAGNPVYVFGSWSNWSDWPGTEMTSIGDDTWEATVNMPSDDDYEFLFVSVYNTDTTTEDMDPSGACTNGDSTYTNRTLTVGSSNMDVCGIWETCMDCYPLSVDGLASENMKVTVNHEGITVNADNAKVVDAVNVYDVTGRQIFSATDVATGRLIPVSLHEGVMYLISVSNDGATETIKSVLH